MTQIKLSHISTGFLAVFVGYASAAAIIYQAASSAGATQAEIGSWFWALGIGMGLSTIVMSYKSKMPIVTAWSTPGAALLITSLDGLTMAQAVGVFLFSSSLITLVGIFGLFDKLLERIPLSIASAMLAGILIQFGLGVFSELMQETLLIVVMLGMFILTKSWFKNLLIPAIFMVVTVACLGMGKLDVGGIELVFTTPVLMTPELDIASMISVGIPLFIVTMASQNLPGFAVLKANGYHTRSSGIITTTGLTGVLLAPFGGFSFNLAAITGAICMGPSADEEPSKRYLAAISMGCFYLLAGVFGMSFVQLFTAIPQSVVIAIAGLAVMAPLASSLTVAMNDDSNREAALMTFLFTASGINMLGVSSAFWGVCLGLFCVWFNGLKQKQAKLTSA